MKVTFGTKAIEFGDFPIIRIWTHCAKVHWQPDSISDKQSLPACHYLPLDESLVRMVEKNIALLHIT